MSCFVSSQLDLMDFARIDLRKLNFLPWKATRMSFLLVNCLRQSPYWSEDLTAAGKFASGSEGICLLQFSKGSCSFALFGQVPLTIIAL